MPAPIKIPLTRTYGALQIYIVLYCIVLPHDLSDLEMIWLR